MTDSCNQEHERNGDVSSSDEDSVSLLDLNPRQSRGDAEDVEISDIDPQSGNKEQKREVELNQLKAAEAGESIRPQSAAGCRLAVEAAPPSAAQVSQGLKIPTKRQLNKRNAKGETPLHRACQRKDLEQVRVLIQAGVSINAEDYAGWTALHEASVVGDTPVVEELLKAGANVNARSFDGVTPLHDAVLSGHYQVVELLLQHGSNSSDRTLGGLSALDMAKEETIKDLLSVQLSAAPHEQPSETAVQSRPGDKSSEVPSCQSSLWSGCSDTADVASRASGDRDGAREPGDIQLNEKDNLSPSEAIAVVLEEVRRKQTEILTWPLTGPEDTGRHRAALTNIQDVLTEVLTTQHLEKDNLVLRYRSVPSYFRQHVLKSQLFSLASRQKTLVEILQKQIHLVEAYSTMKAPNHQSSTSSSTPASCKTRETNSRNQNHRLITRMSVLRSAPPNDTNQLKTQGMRTSTLTAPPGNTVQHMSFQMKGGNALIQTGAEDQRTGLCQLIQRGVMAAGSSLQLLLKGRWHLAFVQDDGSIKDRRGKQHQAPEDWLESILGNNIPVSSAYAWDKVTFRDKPLSYYLLNTEAGGNKLLTHTEVQPRAGSPEEELTTEAAGLRRLMNIKIVHVVGDDEMLPNAVMDGYWEELLQTEAEDWEHD